MANQVVFKRAAWRKDLATGQIVPFGGARKTYVTTVDSAEKARAICKEHNDQRKTKLDTFCEFTAESNY